MPKIWKSRVNDTFSRYFGLHAIPILNYRWRKKLPRLALELPLVSFALLYKYRFIVIGDNDPIKRLFCTMSLTEKSRDHLILKLRSAVLTIKVRQ